MSDADGKVAWVLEQARSGEDVEIFIEDARSATVTAADGQAESAENRHDLGAGLRLFRDGRVGFAYTADLSAAGLGRALDHARALAAHTRQEAENCLPVVDAVITDVTPATVDSGLDASGAARRRLDLACAAETAARTRGKTLLRTRASVVTEAHGRFLIAHSQGMLRRWQWQRAWMHLEVVAEEGGIRQTGFEADWAPDVKGLDAARVGDTAAGRALEKLGAGRPPTARTSVVLHPLAAAGLFQALAAALSGKAVLRQRSLFAGRVGQQIGSAAVTLVDDGAEAGGFATAPVDGEGVTSRRAVLIEAGQLKGFLHNSSTAARLGAASTGHAVRDGYTSLPAVGSRNLHLVPSGPSRKEILAAVDDGIEVEEVMGLHTVDPVTGDFSLGAGGHLLKRGQRGAPVDGFTISGNVLPLLQAVEAVGDDLRFFPGSGGGSTVLLRGITVSGS